MLIEEQFADVRGRPVWLKLPERAWDFLGQEADLLERSQAEEVSQLILAALMAQGMHFEPRLTAECAEGAEK